MAWGNRVIDWPLLGLLAVGLLVGMISTKNVELANAFEGWSPVDYAYAVVDGSHRSTSDFVMVIDHSGHLGNSLAMRIYPWLLSEFAITPEFTQVVFILMTAVGYAGALWFLLRSLRCSLGTPSSLWVALIAALPLLTRVVDCELARFGQANLPFGQAYGVAIPLQLLAMGCAMRGQPLRVGAVLSLLMCVHISLGVMTCVVVGSMLLAPPGGWRRWQVWAAISVPVAVGACWAFVVIGIGDQGARMPLAEWVSWQRMTNFHFFPVDLGMLCSRHFESLTPTMAMALVAVSSPWLTTADPVQRRMWLVAVAASFILTVMGVLFSIFPISISLIMVALHRCSALLLFLLFVPSAVAWWQGAHRGGAINAVVIVWVLAPMISMTTWGGTAVLPALFAALCAVQGWGQERMGRLQRAAVMFAILTVGATTIGVVWSDASSVSNPAVAGRVEAAVLAAGAGIVVWMWRYFDRAAPTEVLLAVFVLGGITGGLYLNWGARSRVPEQASDYLRAQLWTKQHTDPQALFMPDPGVPYGRAWSEYSQRGSFGSVRDWIHIPLCYRADRDGLDEGIRRLSLFGVNPVALNRQSMAPGSVPLMVGAQLQEAFLEAYYSMPSARLLRVARAEGIDYFVFDRSKGHAALPVAYENDSYRICSTGNAAIVTGTP
ncbi:hypothetical protein ACFL6X_01670 [Candidatus Latescibacterota bacterium]